MMTPEQMADSMTLAWNKGSGEGWGAHFDDDVLFVDVLGRTQEGRAVVAREHQKIFDTIYKGSVVKFTVIHQRPLADGLVFAVTFCVLTVPSGPRAGEFKTTLSFVSDGDKILALQNTQLADMSAFSKQDEDLAKLDPLKTRKEA